MKQTIPKPIGLLTSMAYRTASAAANHREDILLAHNTDDKIQADRSAVEVSNCNYHQSRTVLRRAYQLLNEKTEAARTSATITREILKLKLGNQHSERWTGTGFERSLAISRSADGLIPLLLFLSRYLGERPGLQVPDLKVTSSDLHVLHEELLAARNAVNQRIGESNDALDVRKESVARLRKRMSDLIAELKQLLGPLDMRWLAFGLNRPGAEETPEAPEKIEVTVVNQTTALLKFPPAPRANYYRIYRRVIGVDAEPVAIGSPTDCDFTVENLPRGASVEFSVSAVNGGGESALSQPEVIKVE